MQARIINVSSEGHRRGTLNRDDLMSKNGTYNPIQAYYQTKLANILFTKELARRYSSEQIASFALHPGLVNSEVFRHVQDKASIFKPIVTLLTTLLMRTPRSGAQTTIYCALEPDIEKYSGQYFKYVFIVRVIMLLFDLAF